MIDMIKELLWRLLSSGNYTKATIKDEIINYIISISWVLALCILIITIFL